MSLPTFHFILKVPTCVIGYIYDSIVARSIRTFQFSTIRNVWMLNFSDWLPQVFEFADNQVFECSHFLLFASSFVVLFDRRITVSTRSSLHRWNSLAESFRDQRPCTSERSNDDKYSIFISNSRFEPTTSLLCSVFLASLEEQWNACC